MSENRTRETKDARTFEERVFARFDSVDERFDRLEGRLTTVEIKVTNLDGPKFDTKPIWERALAEIAETNRSIRELQSEFQTGIETLRTDLRGEFQTGTESLRTEMKAEFASVRNELEHGLRRVGRRLVWRRGLRFIAPSA